jgi:hypothetical protein
MVALSPMFPLFLVRAKKIIRNNTKQTGVDRDGRTQIVALAQRLGWFLAFQDAVDVGGGKPIQRGLINPEEDQSAFGDETAEVMGSNGAMIVPQDIKPKQTVRQDFRQCLIIAPRSSTCRVQLHWRASDKVPMTAAWRASRRPGTVNSAGRDVAEYNF